MRISPVLRAAKIVIVAAALFAAGCGTSNITDELKETIFYPLVTGKPTGTGLGLTIAQDLVARHGGLIEFTSQPGRTVFQLRLPVAASNGLSAGRG